MHTALPAATLPPYNFNMHLPLSKIQVLAKLASVMLERFNEEEQAEVEATNRTSDAASSFTALQTATRDTAGKDEDEVGDDESLDKENCCAFEQIKGKNLCQPLETEETADEDESEASNYSDDCTEENRSDLDSSDKDSESKNEKSVAADHVSDREIGNQDETGKSYWMRTDWIPTVQSNGGKQQTHPDQIRNELTQYMKAHAKTKKKTALLADLGVNSNSFRKFMDGGNYKDPWRAIENGTYWAAARYLEAERVDPHRKVTSVALSYVPRSIFYSTTKPKATTPRGKRKAKQQSEISSCLWKRPKKSVREAAVQLMHRIGKVVTDATEDRIYESRPRIVTQGVNRKSLDKLLATKKQKDFTSLFVYGRAWVFFEKMRIFDKQPKSAERRKTESDLPQGFVVRHVVVPPLAPLSVVRRRGRTAENLPSS